MKPQAIERWQRIAASGSSQGLEHLLADNIVFQSPVVHTPQVGKAIASKYLAAAIASALNNGSFRWLNEWYGEASAVLEFETTVEGILINGVDLIEWNSKDQIVKFKVMVRPLKAINLLHQLLQRALEAAA